MTLKVAPISLVRRNMPGGRPTTDPKYRRISVRVNEQDLATLERLARDRACTVGEVVRDLIRAHRTVPKKGRSKKGR